jgi:carbamoylphosphate synthase large subunit
VPKFFFDLHEDGRVLRDEDGIELADQRSAERQARRAACDVTKDSFEGDTTVKVRVRDGQGAVLMVEVSARVSSED